MVKHRRFGSAVSVDYHRAGSAGSRLRPGDVPQGSVEAAGGRARHRYHDRAAHPSARDTVFGAVTGLRQRRGTGQRRRQLPQQAVESRSGRTDASRISSRSPTWCSRAWRRRSWCSVRTVSPRPPSGPKSGRARAGPGRHQGRGTRLHGTYRGHRPPACPLCPSEVVDPVGAGDAFVAGYLAELLAGRERRRSGCGRLSPPARTR